MTVRTFARGSLAWSFPHRGLCFFASRRHLAIQAASVCRLFLLHLVRQLRHRVSLEIMIILWLSLSVSLLTVFDDLRHHLLEPHGLMIARMTDFPVHREQRSSARAAPLLTMACFSQFRLWVFPKFCGQATCHVAETFRRQHRALTGSTCLHLQPHPCYYP